MSPTLLAAQLQFHRALRSVGGVRTGDVPETFSRRQDPHLGDEDDDYRVVICGGPVLSSVPDPSMVTVLVSVSAACGHDHPALST